MNSPNNTTTHGKLVTAACLYGTRNKTSEGWYKSYTQKYPQHTERTTKKGFGSTVAISYCGHRHEGTPNTWTEWRNSFYLMGPYNAGPNLTLVLITPVSNCAGYKKVYTFVRKLVKRKGYMLKDAINLISKKDFSKTWYYGSYYTGPSNAGHYQRHSQK